MTSYSKKRNGDERYRYDRDGRAEFSTDGEGRELYARNRAGGEKYPDRGDRVFARDGSGEPYYARDARGDEFYPVRKDRSLLLPLPPGGFSVGPPSDDPSGEPRRTPALKRDGTQRYPRNGRGDEYYLRGLGGEGDGRPRPLLMRNGAGEEYLAAGRNGRALIPWNCLQDYVGEEPCVCSRDSDGNTVYVRESAFPAACRAVVRCVCRLSVVCPEVVGCHARLY